MFQKGFFRLSQDKCNLLKCKGIGIIHILSKNISPHCALVGSLVWLISKHCKNCNHLKSVLCSVQSPINNQLKNSYLIVLSSFNNFLFLLVLFTRLVLTKTVKNPKRVIIKDERNRNNVSVLLPIII